MTIQIETVDERATFHKNKEKVNLQPCDHFLLWTTECRVWLLIQRSDGCLLFVSQISENRSSDSPVQYNVSTFSCFQSLLRKRRNDSNHKKTASFGIIHHVQLLYDITSHQYQVRHLWISKVSSVYPYSKGIFLLRGKTNILR